MPSNLTSISFPASPSVGLTYTYGNQTYQWNGTEWVVSYDSNSIPIGAVTLSGNQTITGVKTFSDNIVASSNLTLAGDLTVDTNTLYINSTTNNVGIGTTSPQTQLEIVVPSTGTTLTGTAKYAGIHLDQNNTNDEFVGITTSATSSGTQGGILFQGSGSYGTKIHFLTTDSYAAGMKNRMTIDSSGRVLIPNQPIFIGYHSGHYNIGFTSASPLPLATAAINIGNCFNTTTYQFTCPVTGWYECSAHDLEISPPSSNALGVFVNGVEITRNFSESRTKTIHCFISCNAGDTIDFRNAYQTSYLFGSANWSRYMIRLVN